MPPSPQVTPLSVVPLIFVYTVYKHAIILLLKCCRPSQSAVVHSESRSIADTPFLYLIPANAYTILSASVNHIRLALADIPRT